MLVDCGECFSWRQTFLHSVAYFPTISVLKLSSSKPYECDDHHHLWMWSKGWRYGSLFWNNQHKPELSQTNMDVWLPITWRRSKLREENPWAKVMWEESICHVLPSFCFSSLMALFGTQWDVREERLDWQTPVLSGTAVGMDLCWKHLWTSCCWVVQPVN